MKTVDITQYQQYDNQRVTFSQYRHNNGVILLYQKQNYIARP